MRGKLSFCLYILFTAFFFFKTRLCHLYSTRYLGDLYGAESDSIYLESMALDPFWCIQWDVWRSNGRDNRTAKINITETQREINCDNNGISDTLNRFQDGSSSSVSEPSERTSNGDKNIIDNKNILKTEIVLVPGVCESNTNFIQKENSIPQNLSKEDSFNITGGFSEKERTCLSSGSLRNKEYLIEEGSLEERSVLLGLADILFSFCFDFRYVK